MIRLFAFALLSATSLSTAYSDELPFDSSIEKVTVYPSGANVIRIAKGQVRQGDHIIIIDDLPGNIQPDSVRVKGSSSGELFQNSVDVRHMNILDSDQPEERKRLERQIEALQDETNRLSRLLSDNELQRQLLQAIASRAFTQPGGDKGAMAVTGAGLTELLESASVKLNALGESEMAAKTRQREISYEIAELQTKIRELAPKNRVQTIVQINVSASDTNASEFEIEYKVEGASWRPVYDAKLEMGEGGKDASISLKRRALVRQNTGESWDNIQLLLSTARPSSATDAPKLRPYEIDFLRPEPLRKKRTLQLQSMNDSVASGEGAMVTKLAAAPKIQHEVVQQEVGVDYSGFQAIFHIQGQSSIANNGETKSVNIDTYDIAASLHTRTVPMLDPTAYLVAGFTYDGSTPLLPGPVLLSRDGAFIGRGSLPMISSGDTYELGFGADDLVKVERVEIGKQKGESGFVSTVNTDLRKYRTTVTNLHDFDMTVEVVDRLPVSNHEDIEIVLTKDTTQPTEKNQKGQRGLMGWTLDIAGNEKAVIDFGYEISWPKELAINLSN